jgi:predicted site-specific integrase-resolvase
MHDVAANCRLKTTLGSVAIYARVSTEEQRERQSIDTQKEFGAKYTDLHELRVHRVYADDGVSGTIPLEKRPEGSRILVAARRGEFNQLLIYKLDRLGRDTRLILNAVAELEKHGVRVRSVYSLRADKIPLNKSRQTADRPRGGHRCGRFGELFAGSPAKNRRD